VTGTEPELSAWEAERSRLLGALSWESACPLMTVTDPWSPGLMARRYCLVTELRQEFEIFHVGEDAVVRHDRNQIAVAATQRSASCSFWPRPCPVRTHHVRSDAYASARCGPGHTISARAIS
jgi:hypothetical protein